jgi:hypothetical protein
VVLESQAIKDANALENARAAKSSKGAFASLRNGPDQELPSIGLDSKDSNLPQPTLTSTDGFWRKIRASTRPKESIEASRSTSRCESRATRRTCDELDDIRTGKQSTNWWSRIRDNAAKMVGQSAASSRPPTVHLQRPSMTVDDDQSRFKGSLDAAMTLADGFRGHSADGPTTDCDGE